jgi:histidinol-phosphate aminotransferase
VELGKEAEPIAKRLEQEGVLVRPLALWGAPEAVRVTIGTPEQNEFFVCVFRKVIEKSVMTQERILGETP